jgi:hypothetical protein
MKAADNNVVIEKATQIASGFGHQCDPAAFVVGPTGVALDEEKDILYIFSTVDNAIFGIANASDRTSDAGMGHLVVQDQVYLHGPLGLVLAPNGSWSSLCARVVSNLKASRARWRVSNCAREGILRRFAPTSSIASASSAGLPKLNSKMDSASPARCNWKPAATAFRLRARRERALVGPFRTSSSRRPMTPGAC